MDASQWKKIDDLLDVLIDLEPEKRSAFLDHACVNDVDLRKKLEALLAADRKNCGIIDIPLLRPSLDAEHKVKPRFLEHQIVAGRYEILSRLGSGGMGEVWHAYDVKLRMDVALKTLRFDLIKNDERIETLRSEVRNAREVISPNVCRIFDLISEENQELISMEYIDGMTLSSMLEQKESIPMSEARDIAAQFLSGLEAIHCSGLVHCDLKPENIMVTRTGRVVLMDFGIAKHSKHEATLTVGTLPYIPPEYLSGVAIDPKFDLFSAGIILAEIIYSSGIVARKSREEIWNIVHHSPEELPESVWKSVIMRAISRNPESRFASARSLSRALEEATVRLETIEDRDPYPGLSAFTIGEAEHFFGREPEVEALINKLRQLHLMALIGPSGAGKTSMLRAGLIPSLPDGWNYLYCQPGDSPFLNLGQALTRFYTGDTKAIEQLIHLERLEIAIELIHSWRKKYPEAVIVVDRFEELFTLNSKEIQEKFALLIHKAAVEADVRILLAMRDDFLVFCKEYLPLAPIFSELTAILPLSGAALRRALIQPALKCGYRFEDEQLTDEIISSVEEERGALPLMSFAAARLWEKRDRLSGLLTWQAYREIGGVEGALAQHADTTLERIGTEKIPVVREIFRNLVTAENTRAARDFDDLLSLFPDSMSATKILGMLIDARLLTSFEMPQLEEEIPKRRVEIIHESLLTHWPRLVRWQTQDADGAQLRDELRQSAQLWERRNRSEDLLWTGSAFLEFQSWRQFYPGRLTTSEEAFAEAMTQRANKRRTRQRIATIVLIGLLIGILLVITNFWREATTSKNRAVLEAKRAEAGKVLVLGQTDAEPNSKLAYAMASLELFDTQEGRRFAMQALSAGAAARITRLPLKQTFFLEFSPDDRWVAAGAISGVQLLPWSGRAPMVLEDREPVVFNARAGQFSSDGKFVVWKSAENPNWTKVWSVDQQKIIRTLRWEGYTSPFVRGMKTFFFTDLTGRMPKSWDWGDTLFRVWDFDSTDPKVIGHWNHSAVGDIDFNHDGQWAAYAKGRDLYIRSVNGSKLGPEMCIGRNSSELKQVLCHPNGNEILTLDTAGEITFWSIDPKNKNPLRIFSRKGGIDYFWLDPKGSFLALQKDNKILRFDLSALNDAEPMVFSYLNETPQQVKFDYQQQWMSILWDSVLAFYPLTHTYPYTFKSAKANWSFSIRFMPDGKSFITSLTEEGIRMWNIPGQENSSVKTLWKPAAGSVQAIDIDPMGKKLLAGVNDQGVYLINFADGKTRQLSNCLPTKEIDSISFSPDGNTAAAVAIHGLSENHGIQFWDLQSGKCKVINGSEGKASFSVKFLPDGNLLSGDIQGNLYEWNLNDGSHRILSKGKGIVSRIAVTHDGRYVAASILSVQRWDDVRSANSELIVYDLKENKSSTITSHGNRIFSVAFDQAGTRLITGDIDGVIRIGPITGETPHLLLGSESMIGDIAVDPSDRWIASTEFFKPAVRLWPMPEGMPLQALPYDQFLNRLRDLTNMRVVPDSRSSTGYQIEYADFPGWKEVPKW